MADAGSTTVPATTLLGTSLTTASFAFVALKVYHWNRPKIWPVPIVAVLCATSLYLWSMVVAVAPYDKFAEPPSWVAWALTGGDGLVMNWAPIVVGTVWAEFALREITSDTFRRIKRFRERKDKKLDDLEAGQDLSLESRDGSREATAKKMSWVDKFMADHMKLKREVRDHAQQRLGPERNNVPQMIDLSEEVDARVLRFFDEAVDRQRNGYRCRSCQQMCTPLFRAPTLEQTAPAST